MATVTGGHKVESSAPTEDALRANNVTSDVVNPYLEVVRKRLRTLTKKMLKIEKYESLPKDKLEDDQMQVIARKPAIQSSIDELKMVLLNLLAVSEAQKKEQAQKDMESRREQEKKQSRIRKEAVDRLEEKYGHVFDAIFTVNILSSDSSVTSQILKNFVPGGVLATFSDIVKNGLHASKSQICSRDEYTSFFRAFVRPYAISSQKHFAEQYSYRDLRSAVDTVLEEFSRIKNVPPPTEVLANHEENTSPQQPLEDQYQGEVANLEPQGDNDYLHTHPSGSPPDSPSYDDNKDHSLSNSMSNLAIGIVEDINYVKPNVPDVQVTPPEPHPHEDTKFPSKNFHRRSQPQAYQGRPQAQRRLYKRTFGPRMSQQPNHGAQGRCAPGDHGAPSTDRSANFNTYS